MKTLFLFRKKKEPVLRGRHEITIYDFLSMAIGKGIPYGVYDQGQNKGWVNVGIDHDTSTFAVETIRRWWYSMVRKVYPDAQQLLITADGGGGSNGYRVRRSGRWSFRTLPANSAPIPTTSAVKSRRKR